MRIIITTIAAAGLSLVAAALPVAASAQGIDARQDRLEQRIDRGVRQGTLTRGEAQRLRRDYRELARLEYRYRRSNGLSIAERRDLDRRFDALSRRVRDERRDRDYRGR